MQPPSEFIQKDKNIASVRIHEVIPEIPPQLGSLYLAIQKDHIWNKQTKQHVLFPVSESV